MTTDEKSITVDIEKVIKSQKAFILRKLPRFIIRLIERIIHQKELNELLLSLKNKIGFDFLDGLVDYFQLKTEVVGEENLPNHNRLIFVLNHSLGALEGIASLHYLKNINPNILVLANKLLANIKNARPYMLPVNAFGKTDKAAMIKIAETYKSETNIYTFPAGRVSRIVDGQVRDRDWHKSFVENSKRYKRKIVPIFIENINSKLFYRVYKIRKFLRIKTNFELFLLPHEMFTGKGTIIKMKIGKAIPHTVFTDEFSAYEWAQKVKDHLYKFTDNHNRVFSENTPANT